MKKTRIGLSLIAFAAIAMCSGNARANESAEFYNRYLGEMNLGTTKISHGRSVERVFVKSCANGMLIDSVKVRITNNDADIDNIAILFEDGQAVDLPVRRHFDEDSESMWFNLFGMRCINSFVIYGETKAVLPIFKRAKIKLIGNAFSTY